ncbi:myosin-11-like isoform X2 [Venturia canescens]|uniref:myosin-11-like isoform X2 n=1 Tax=Venturia canescens TaxID=32260 RepID=UPI001C9C8354|nr:myosin-11-like isoform X2 [Venturia canescens]
MEEHGKRKVEDSKKNNNTEASTSRSSKVRKLNHPMENPQDTVTQILSHDAPKGSNLTQKLVSMWLGGSQGRDSLLTQEVRESIAVRESQQKCAEAESLLEKIQQKVQSAEVHITDLTKDLKSEKKTNARLIDKINSTAEMVTVITEHINCAIDTLERCRQQKDHLHNLYDNIILRQIADLANVKNHEESLKTRISELQAEVVSLNKKFNDIQSSCENKLKQKETELARVAAKCEVIQKNLEKVIEEKEEVSRALAIKENYNFDIQTKICAYENEVKNLTTQLTQVSTTLEIVNEKNLQLTNELECKISETLKLVDDLNHSKTKHFEEISSMKNMNRQLEEKLNCEYNERESLKQKLDETNELKNELAQQLEKLKDDTSLEIEEMKKRLEYVETDKMRIHEEDKQMMEQMERKYEAHVEKYELLLAEMKALENDHRNELSRMNESSSTAISSANVDVLRLQKQIDTLTREKEKQEIELRRVEDLLMRHTKSEMQLKRQVEQYKDEAAALTVTMTVASEQKKQQEAQNQENLNKIRNLELELVKLQFQQPKCNQNEPQVQTSDGEDQRDREPLPRKRTAPSTYQKSILKRGPKARKTRSSPTSPILPGNQRKITFLDVNSSSDTSPVKMFVNSNISSFDYFNL